MKKVLTVLLTLLMVFTLVGCNGSKQEEPTIENEPEVNEPIVGGYVDAEDKNLTPELIEMFEKAFEGFAGASYTPVMLEATQVVAGTNYKFLADGSKTTNPMIQGTYYVYINKDLQGNISLLDIEVIDEHEVKEFEPEVKPDTEINEDITNMSFWVVFYDQYGNEVQREVLKYEAVPSFKGSLPEGFECWVYKDSDINVDEFKQIKTNTYFFAKCHNVYHEPIDNTPKKGELIKMYVGAGVEGTDVDGNMIFRVLAKEGNIYKLLGLNSIKNHEFHTYTKKTNYDGIESMYYDGEQIDTILSNWYTTLDSNVKSAIKSTNLKQYLIELFDECEEGSIPFGSYYYKFNKYVELANSKYVFALDIDDILDYLDGALNKEGIKNMLSINGTSFAVWPRSAGYDHIHPCEENVCIRLNDSANNGFSVFPIGGDPEANIVPSFYIDLTADDIVYEMYSEN